MDSEEANKFINSLVKNLQVLCHGHVNFSNSIQVIGHLYLNVDSNVNIDYIVNEKVCKSDTSSTVFVSKSYHSEPQKKSKLLPEKSAVQERRHSQLESNADLRNEQNIHHMPRTVKSERQSFSSQNYMQKTSTPTQSIRRPSGHNLEGPSHKMPRLSQSPNMSPSGNRNSQFTSIKLEDRDPLGDNSSHHIDLSHLQQTNISETSFHIPHSSNSNSQRIPHNTTEDSNVEKSPIKEEPYMQIDLSTIKDEPDDHGPDDSMGDMSNDEFLSSLHEKTTNVYPVGLHSNEAQSSEPFNMQDFSLPLSFQQVGAGAGPSTPGSVHPDGTSNVQLSRNQAQCPMCGSIMHKRSVQRHIRETHLKIRHPCDLCGQEFSQKNHMLAHKQRRHGEINPCGRSGFSSSDLSQQNNYISQQLSILQHVQTRLPNAQDNERNSSSHIESQVNQRQKLESKDTLASSEPPIGDD